MEYRKITLEEVKANSFKVEPHTVALKDEGEWWGVFKDGQLISVLCVSDKHGGKYLSENYTDPAFRGQGVFTNLLNHVINQVYPKDKIIAHCLKASRNCYLRLGFIEVRIREFKHGTQYHMVRNVINVYRR